MNRLDIHIAKGGETIEAITTDGDTICWKCQFLQPSTIPEYVGYCHKGRVWIEASYQWCKQFKEAAHGQRTLL